MGLFERLRGGDEPRVAFLGIDGVPHELIEDRPDVFPNLHALADDGTSGRISSIVPPESSACWPSLTTGVNPGATGVYGFQDRNVDSYETYVPVGSHVKATRIWERVDTVGRNATVLNVPVTFPPDPDVQRMVSGFLSPSLEDAANDEAVQYVLEQYNYQIDVDASLGHEDDKSSFIDDAYGTLESRYRVFDHYFEEDDWDLFFGVFMTTDRINHFLYGDYEEGSEYADEFLEFYRQLDEYIGKLQTTLSDDVSLIIASDHGFTRLDYEVNLNEYLHEQGWLEYASDDHDSLEDISDTTRAYSFIPGRVYLNLEGREPNGSVSEDEYERVREELIDDLEALTGPDGQQVCRRIVTTEHAFDGNFTEIAPDLVIIPADGYDLKSGFETKDSVFTTGPRNGMHKFENATLFSDAELKIDDTDLFDITPTILDLLDIEYAPDEFDGESIVA